MVIGHILRVASFLRLEWLAHSPVRAELGIQNQFGDDALAYCTERMDPETTRLALAAALHQAKRNKAFENSRFIGLALDGTGAGRTYKEPCPLCDPMKDPKGEVHGCLHHFVLISVVGVGLTLPIDVEPYGPGDSDWLFVAYQWDPTLSSPTAGNTATRAVIRCITAQNPLGVSAIHAVPAEIILAQVRAVSEDIGVDAVKVGMLGTRDIALAVAQALDELPRETPVVVDPVMVAESGAVLLEAEARRALIDAILPRATVVTPNVLEARVLAGLEPDARGELAGDEHAEVLELARAVLALGPDAALVTGGHRAHVVDPFLKAGEDPVETGPQLGHELLVPTLHFLICRASSSTTD